LKRVRSYIGGKHQIKRGHEFISLGDGRVEYPVDLLEDLKAHGLQPTLSKIYLLLLTNGPQSAREISKNLHLHRTDTYKKLEQLFALGMIQVTLKSPKLYSCVDPQVALSSLMKKEETRLKELRVMTWKMARRLNALVSSYALNEAFLPTKGEPYYKYLNN